MKQTHYDTFVALLDQENKDAALVFCLNLLKENKLTLEELYQTVLAPSLSNFVCDSQNEEICIWKEHTRTSIVRMILENTYPFVIERKKNIVQNHKKVVVVTPVHEYHEIGAILATNFFILAGFDAQYIGANTPNQEILSAVKILKPDYLAISVTNPYNLVATKQVCDAIKTEFPHTKIIVGGQAFATRETTDSLHYTHKIVSLTDIFELGKQVIA